MSFGTECIAMQQQKLVPFRYECDLHRCRCMVKLSQIIKQPCNIKDVITPADTSVTTEYMDPLTTENVAKVTAHERRHQ
jgi:hypothetical protein